MAMVLSKSAFKPSVYQSGVFDWIVNGSGHAVIKAVPGSGKSTTLIEGSTLLGSHLKSVFLAFNVNIKEDLADKLEKKGASMKASTINSFGFSALKTIFPAEKFPRGTGVISNKYKNIAKQYLLDRNMYEYKFYEKYCKLVSLVRMTLTPLDEKSIADVADHYDIDIDRQYEADLWNVAWRGIPLILGAGIQQVFFGQDKPTENEAAIVKPIVEAAINGARVEKAMLIAAVEATKNHKGVIDFDDQVRLPIDWNLSPEKLDWIFIDEAQDLNAARLELIIRACKENGRMLFVGDESQSIMGFSGADTDSMNNIIKRTNATVLPLSICYRCPKSHIDLCASVYPGLEAKEDAEQGIIDLVKPEMLESVAKPGDLLLCRLNAPLVSTCLSLIRSGVRAKVRGKDIGANLVSLIEKINKQNTGRITVRNFPEFVGEYERQQAILIGTDPESEMKLEAMYDKCETMRALHKGYCENNAPDFWSLDGMYAYIKDFFSDERGDQVILSTVHKAKGLEEKRVFILRPETMPHPKAKLGWQLEQEHNIAYVAYSRSKSELYFVADHIMMCPRFVQDLLMPDTIDSQRIGFDVETPVSTHEEEIVVEPIITTPKPIIVEQPVSTPETRYPVAQPRGKASDKKAVKGVAYNFPPELCDKLDMAAQLILEATGEKFDKSAYVAGRVFGQYLDIDTLIASLQGQDNTPDPDNGGAPVPETSHEEGKPFGETLASFFNLAIQDAASRGYTVQAVVSTPEPTMPTVAPLSGVQQAMPFEDVVDEEQVVRRFYICGSKFCTVKRWGYDYHRDPRTRELYRFDAQGKRITADDDAAKCPHCGNAGKFMKIKQLKATYHAGTKCTGSCQNATSDECNCQCAGHNHGKKRMQGIVLLNPFVKETK